MTGSPVKAKSDERRVVNVVTTRRVGFLERKFFDSDDALRTPCNQQLAKNGRAQKAKSITAGHNSSTDFTCVQQAKTAGRDPTCSY